MLQEEIRQALRSLRRAPGLTAISILTIALGVGAGTALFSVVKAVLLNPLPFAEPERLAWVAPLSESRTEVRVSLPDLDDWRKDTHTFSRLAAYADAPFLAGGGPNPERTMGTIVTEDFFETFGVRPMMGRVMSWDEHHRGAPLGVVVIGHGLWQRAYGGDPKIVGRRISVIGLRATVIGVMPRGFNYPPGTELWTPARTLGNPYLRTAHNFFAVGRVRPGVGVAAAREDLSMIAARIKQREPSAMQPGEVAVTPLSTHMTGDVRTPLIILFGAVLLVVLIVCVNVANLLLVRVTSRWRELAVRVAMGAERRHLFRHLIVESLLLAAAGGAMGLLAASWLVDALRFANPGKCSAGWRCSVGFWRAAVRDRAHRPGGGAVRRAALMAGDAVERSRGVERRRSRTEWNEALALAAIDAGGFRSGAIAAAAVGRRTADHQLRPAEPRGPGFSQRRRAGGGSLVPDEPR